MAEVVGAGVVTIDYISILYGVSWLVAPDAWWERNDLRVVIARMVTVAIASLVILIMFPPQWTLRSVFLLQTLCLLLPFIYLQTRMRLLEVQSKSKKGKGKSNRYMQWWILVKKTTLNNLSMVCSGNVYYWRDYIIGPIGEEVVFRHLFLTRIIPHRNVLAALLFGLVHAHALIISPGDWIPISIQCIFTGLFGWFVGKIFQRTSSLLTCILVHSLCNIVGLPDLEDLTAVDYKGRIIFLILLAISLIVFIS